MDKDASVVEEGQINNLRSIMDIIQALGSMVASLQLASGRQQMGGHSRRGDLEGFRHKSPGWRGSQHLAQDRHLMIKSVAGANNLRLTP